MLLKQLCQPLEDYDYTVNVVRHYFVHLSCDIPVMYISLRLLVH